MTYLHSPQSKGIRQQLLKKLFFKDNPCWK